MFRRRRCTTAPASDRCSSASRRPEASLLAPEAEAPGRAAKEVHPFQEDQQMKILVANLGSTSFKYRLFELPGQGGLGSGTEAIERELARGGVERIGAPESRVYAQAGGHSLEAVQPVSDHAVALQAALG